MLNVEVAARALFDDFPGAERAANALGLVQKRGVIEPIVAIYVPPPALQAPPGVLLDVSVDESERSSWIAIALGHLVLGHLSVEAYAWSREGPAFLGAREAREAQLFAQAFTAAGRGTEHDGKRSPLPLHPGATQQGRRS